MNIVDFNLISSVLIYFHNYIIMNLNLNININFLWKWVKMLSSTKFKVVLISDSQLI